MSNTNMSYPSQLNTALPDAATFLSARYRQAELFFEMLDRRLTNGKIAELTASTGGVKLTWNKRFTVTAGMANMKRKHHKHTHRDGTKSIICHNYAMIELSDKLITDTDRLYDVVAHEFCHLAHYFLDGDVGPAHGYGFMAWARECNETFAHLNLNVNRYHRFVPHHQYIWTCTNCGEEVGRHSNSFDVEKTPCEVCGGKLVRTNPLPQPLHR